MKQKRIDTVNQALGQATQMLGGATAHGAAIGIKQNDGAAITEDRDALVEARNDHDTAKAELKTRQTTLMSLVITAIMFVTLCREILRIHLGREYSTAWELAGFVRKLAIPRSLAGLKALLEKLFAYFTANPTHQNTEANVTAVRAKALFDQIVAAENERNAQRTVVRTASETKKAAFKTLSKRISGTFRELNQRLEPTDVRYLSFGFNIPAVQSTPEVPLHLEIVLTGPTAAALSWDAAARAESYRIWKKVVGVDEEFVLVTSRADLDFVIEGLPSGKTIQFAVSAVNSGGESVKSNVVTVTTA